MLVLSTWSSLDDWDRWVNSEERGKLENKLAVCLKGPAKIRAFMASADYISEASR